MIPFISYLLSPLNLQVVFAEAGKWGPTGTYQVHLKGFEVPVGVDVRQVQS